LRFNTRSAIHLAAVCRHLPGEPPRRLAKRGRPRRSSSCQRTHIPATAGGSEYWSVATNTPHETKACSCSLAAELENLDPRTCAFGLTCPEDYEEKLCRSTYVFFLRGSCGPTNGGILESLLEEVGRLTEDHSLFNQRRVRRAEASPHRPKAQPR
jgi:hypothetical protein